MASISLPRVLQPRKTSLEVQRENFEKFQTQAINKAVNPLETPVKEKHVRSLIIGTFHEKGAGTFWVVALRLPLQDNRIVAWKFCHVLHKVLREGHFNCLQNSQRHRDMLVNLGKLWVHLKEGYGKLIQVYCNLMVTKINFHERNPQFPGNLQLTGEELETIGDNDINIYFQLSVEMFDYMDDVLCLQGAIFDLYDSSRSSSMSSSGQCRLAPLIPCIQDSNQLYDFSVKLLFKLHSMLPPDTLSGHRERFSKQFKLLKRFYQNVDNMQYFKNLITIPRLPDSPPNFLIQSELTSYRPPVVILPPEEQYDEQEMIANLIDTSESSSQIMSPDTTSDIVDYAGTSSQPISELLVQRDNLIDNLQSEITRLRNEKECQASEHRATIASMNDQVRLSEEKLIAAKRAIECEKEQLVLLRQQPPQQSAPDSEQKITAAEEKTKVLEEKYQKLKAAYIQMREEHINLIRQNADTEKQVGQLKKITSEQETKSAALESTINELKSEVSRISELQLQNSNEADFERLEIETLSQKHQIENTENKLDWCKKEKYNLESELQDLLQNKGSLEESLAELSMKCKDSEDMLLKEKENITLLLWQSMRCGIQSAYDIIKGTTEELDNPAISSLQCGPDYLRTLLPQTENSLSNLEKSLITLEQNKTPSEDVAKHIVNATHLLSSVIIEGVATSNTSKDIVFGENMAQECRELANAMTNCIRYVQLQDTSVKIKENGMLNGVDSNAEAHISNIRKLLGSVAELAGRVSGQDEEGSSDSFEGELANMDKAIEEAAARIEAMLQASRAVDSGIKLEVNEKILDACTSLMGAVRELVKKSRSLQAEIVSEGKGTNTAKEFYKRNHQWTEGLISAAKAVALGANLLLTSADKVVTSGGKLEQVMVASQEIAASTAQLVVASRVRASRGSQGLQALSVASRAVSSATGAVIATAKSCSQLVEDSEELDISGMSLQVGRRKEMDSRVRVLELEQALATERLKLAALRRTNYRLADTEQDNTQT